VAILLALVAVLGLTLRPACDVLAAAHAGSGTQPALVQIADAPGVDDLGHNDNDGPCCSSVEDGSLVAPDSSSVIAGAGAQPAIASFPPWRIPNSVVGRPLPAAGPSAFLPPAFHARSAPLRV